MDSHVFWRLTFTDSAGAVTSMTLCSSLAGTSGDSLVQPRRSKQGQLEQVARDIVQLGLEHLRVWRLHNLSA